MAKLLKLRFRVEPRGYYDIDIEQPKPDLKAEEVKLLMEKIVADKIFQPKNGDIYAVDSAIIVEETQTAVL